MVTNNGVTYTASSGTRLLYIFDNDGNRVANYDAGQKFYLDNGTYKFFCATPLAKIPTGTVEELEGQIESVITAYKLDELILPQSETGADTLTISDVVTYNVPSNDHLTVHMTTRTGRLTFNSLDTKPEMANSYNRVRVVLKVKRTGYKIANATYIAGNIDVAREQTTNAGIGVRETFAVFPTEDEANGITLIVEYYKDEELVGTKTLPETLQVEANKTTLVEAYLNDPDPHLINNFSVTITDDPWEDETIKILPPIEVPDGYILVPLGGDVRSYINGIEGDTPINLVLTPGGTYTIGSSTTIKSNVHILAGKRTGDARPIVSMSNNFAVDGTTVKSIVLEGVDFAANGTGKYFFNNGGSAEFHLDELTFIDCSFIDYGRSIFRVQQGTAGMNTVKKILIDNCNFVSYGADKYALIRGNGDNNIFQDVEVKNSTFTFAATGNKAMMENTGSVTSAMAVSMTNCTFFTVSTMPLFDMRAGSGGTMNFSLVNSLFTGENPTSGLRTSGGSTYTFTNNYCTSGWLPGSYTFSTAPTETVSATDLFTAPAELDYTIKDKTSAVYLNKIGDPRWIK